MLGPSTSHAFHPNSTINVVVISSSNGKREIIAMENGSKIRDIKPKIRSLFQISPSKQFALYMARDAHNTPLDDEFVLKDDYHLMFSEDKSNDSPGSDQNTSNDAPSISSRSGPSNEEDKQLSSDEERWLQQYFKTKFGLTHRF